MQAPNSLRESPEFALRLERLSGVESFVRLGSEWEALDAKISPRTPFTSPLWNILWWKYFSAGGLFLRDEFITYLVRDADGTLVAVAPMMLTHVPSVGPARVRILQFFGADPNITEVRGLVCRPEDQADVIAALTPCFLERAADWDWIDWGHIRDTGASRRLLQSGPVEQYKLIPGYQLELPATWEEFRASRGRNIKGSLRKCYNSLKRAGQSFIFRVVERPDETPAAIQTFFELHAERARAVDTVEHADVFAGPRARAFLAEYARCAAERGQLRIFQLEIDGQVVATRLGFRLGDELYLYYSGYATSWGKFSVMTTLFAESIKWAISQHLRIVNLSLGNDVSKARWDPKEVMFANARQLCHARSARLAFRAYHAVERHRRSRLGKLLTVMVGR